MKEHLGLPALEYAPPLPISGAWKAKIEEMVRDVMENSDVWERMKDRTIDDLAKAETPQFVETKEHQAAIIEAEIALMEAD